MVGQSVGHYRILEKLGEGGMGVVYKARDTRLDRLVALKLLPPEVAKPEGKRRFLQEARAASALNHPNIVTVHDILEEGGAEFIVMEYVQGKTLGQLIGPKGLKLDEALKYALEMAGALSAAHRAGIIHRDLKPANVMVTGAPSGPGLAKVLDFGLAKLTQLTPADQLAETETVKAGEPTLTEAGTILGTVAYMSPEQVEGKRVDARSDIFSFGAVLYEMVTGRRAFQGDSRISTMSAILRDTPPPVKRVRPDVPAELNRILFRCLEKNREARYPSGGELHKDLVACQARLAAPLSRLRSALRRPKYAVAAVVLLGALAAAASWLWIESSRARWARNQALPEITRLMEQGKYYAALRLAREAQRYIPDDPQLRQLWDKFAVPVSIRSTPPGAEVYVKDYLAVDAPWDFLGKTPMENTNLPFSSLRFRIAKEGFSALEQTSTAWTVAFLMTKVIHLKLEPQATSPPGMVGVPGGSYQLRRVPAIQLQDYWLDKYEVTNKQFKEFVDRGGYQKREYWKHPFVENGRTLSWEEVAGRFRDATGRPGPSTWELGSYLEGQDEFPVSGVSWYEAAAYAEFAGKSLPTVYHWYNAAAGLGMFADIVQLSNFGGRGPARVGSHQGLSPYGSYDMAGNVKEWCWNEVGGAGYRVPTGWGEARRYILGGAWNEPSYMFEIPHAQSPFDRSATYGFRCAKYSGPLSEVLTNPVERLVRDFTREKPVNDEIFKFYRSIYSYDRTDLKSRVELVDESSRHWRLEKITFDAAYGGERMIAYLFLPRSAVPPFQTVIYFPGRQALYLKSIETLGVFFPDFIIRSGRAVLWPIYKGTYERRSEIPQEGPSQTRDRVICWSKDLGRSIDYLETRQDTDRGKLAYYGISMGAAWAPVLTALEERLKTSMLIVGGFYFERYPPEIDAFNFAPRARIPVLMINGRYDFRFPLESSQLPLFRALGAPGKDKRHVLFDSGHVPPSMTPAIKETLDWLDRYLGPVKMKP